MNALKPVGKIIAKYEADYIVDSFNNTLKTATLHGYVFKVNSKSLTNRKRRVLLKSQECVCCGRKGNIFILEDRSKTDEIESVLTLYNTKEYSKKGNLKYIPFSVDHIIPKALGGSDGLYNLQTMCVHCNRMKNVEIQFKYLSTRLIFKLLKHNRKILFRLVKILADQKLKILKNKLFNRYFGIISFIH